MTWFLFLQCVVCGFLGIFFQLLIKIRALRKRAKAGNASFSIRAFLVDDWDTILISMVTVFIFIVLFPSLVRYKQAFAEWVNALFVFVGYTGSSILLSFFSKAEKRVLEVVDKKTNKADGIADSEN